MSCKQCSLTHNCVCEALPHIDPPFELVLLYHPNEIHRATNTGKLLSLTLSQISQYQWSRTEPPQELLQRIKQHGNAKLLFPSDKSTPLQGAESEHTLYIILDATWQKARKMLNRSPWLQELAQVHLQGGNHSQYTLRRNQNSRNLCTFEVGSAMVQAYGDIQSAQKLTTFFEYYLTVFQADRSGHKFNS